MPKFPFAMTWLIPRLILFKICSFFWCHPETDIPCIFCTICKYVLGKFSKKERLQEVTKELQKNIWKTEMAQMESYNQCTHTLTQRNTHSSDTQRKLKSSKFQIFVATIFYCFFSVKDNLSRKKANFLSFTQLVVCHHKQQQPNHG